MKVRMMQPTHRYRLGLFSQGQDHSGKNNGNYKTGYTLVQHFCPKCQTPIGITSKQCRKCAHSRPIHSAEYKSRLSTQMKGSKNRRFGKTMTPTWGEYQGVKMRSSWERLYALYLDTHNIRWQYENKTFDLDSTTYTPDFYLPHTDEFIEIKGFDTTLFLHKLQLFKMKYPKIRLRILYGDDLKQLGII